jgi:hypothetical protein
MGWWVDTIVSEEHTASIFRAEDGMCSSETLYLDTGLRDCTTLKTTIDGGVKSSVFKTDSTFLVVLFSRVMYSIGIRNTKLLLRDEQMAVVTGRLSDKRRQVERWLTDESLVISYVCCTCEQQTRIQ